MRGNGFEGGSEFRLRAPRRARRGTVPKIVSRPPWPPPLATPATVSESIYIPRAAVPFHLRRRRRCRRTRTSVCRPLTHSQYSNLNAPSFPCLLPPSPWAGWQEPVWHYGSFFLPASLHLPLPLCHRNRHSPSLVSLHQSRIDGMASFPLSFFCSLSLSFPPLLRVYLWTKCANNNVNSHYHKERAASFGSLG